MKIGKIDTIKFLRNIPDQKAIDELIKLIHERDPMNEGAYKESILNQHREPKGDKLDTFI